MTTARTLARIDTYAWVLIYGGLFSIVLGIASHSHTRIGGWSLGALGIVATIAGVVLIVVRARLREPEAEGAQSKTTAPGKKT